MKYKSHTASEKDNMKQDKPYDHKKLITILKGLLNTQDDLDFLLELKDKDLEKLVGIVRERVDG
jgi:hypothetical protein